MIRSGGKAVVKDWSILDLILALMCNKYVCKELFLENFVKKRNSFPI